MSDETFERKVTTAEREPRKAFRQVDADKAMTEHKIAQKAFSNNRERLKAERLAREAAEPVIATTKSKPKKKKIATNRQPGMRVILPPSASL